MLKINIEELPNFITLALKSQNNLLVVGDPGVGKSQVINGMTKDKHIKVTSFTGSSTYEETINGIPYHDKGDNRQKYLEPEWHINIWDWADQSKDNINVLFLDEFNTAEPQVLTTFLSILTERKVPTQSRPLPDNTVIVAAMNPVEQNDGTPLIRPLASRFMTVKIDSTLDSYKYYLLGLKDEERLSIKVREKPIELTDQEKIYIVNQLSGTDWGRWSDGEYHELCPRSLTNMFRTLGYATTQRNQLNGSIVRALGLAFIGKELRWDEDAIKNTHIEMIKRNKQKLYYTQEELRQLSDGEFRQYAIDLSRPNLKHSEKLTTARINLQSEADDRNIDLSDLMGDKE